jgi:hypothetical protein
MTESRPRFPSGPLNAALDAFKAACARDWPPDAFALVNQTLADLAQTGMQQSALQAGDTAPRFTLPDQQGCLVHAQELLAHGPLVLVFYRGMW